jgi:hypothetical protein
MMMGNGCPMMAKADSMKCSMETDSRCPMAADKCPVTSHHESKTWTAPDHGAP